MKEIIQTSAAPKAIGTYSQAIKVDNWLYCSGQIPLDPATMEIVSGGFEQQAHQVFQNLRAVLQAAEMNFDHVIKLTVFVTDLQEFATFNQVMGTYFSAPYPARSVVQVVALPRQALVEVEAVAQNSN